MIAFEDAFNLALQQTNRLAPVKLPLDQCVGNVLAESAVSPIDVPPFTRSTVDGYAVHSDDARDDKAILEVIGEFEPGRVPDIILERGQAAKLRANTPLPQGSNAVQREEFVRPLLEGERVGMLAPANSWENVEVKGERLKQGETVVKTGACIRSNEIGLLATVGYKKLNIFPAPRIHILAIGDEFETEDTKLKRGMMWESGSHILLTAMEEIGADVEFLGIVPQKPEMIENKLSEKKARNLCLISGGTSLSGSKMMAQILKKIGAHMIFEQVAVKPGSGLALAKSEYTLFFVLPEDPFAVSICFDVFIYPVIRKMMGFSRLKRPTSRAILESTFKKEADFHVFQPAFIKYSNHKALVKPVVNYGKANMISLTKCNAIMSIPAGTAKIKKGKPVEVILKNGFFQ